LPCYRINKFNSTDIAKFLATFGAIPDGFTIFTRGALLVFIFFNHILGLPGYSTLEVFGRWYGLYNLMSLLKRLASACFAFAGTLASGKAKACVDGFFHKFFSINLVPASIKCFSQKLTPSKI
jgi:hypothetical protein